MQSGNKKNGGNKVIALVGCASNWQRDLDSLGELGASFDVMAIGLDCPYKGNVKYFATYHIADIPLYQIKRGREGLNTDYKIIAHKSDKKNHVDAVFEYQSPSGSSALLGVFASLEFGYDKIVLCGCPLEGANAKKHPYSVFRKGWQVHKNEVIGKVKSMSGWTAEFLGKPTREWLNE
jgi:hypothetical protein